MDHEWGSGVCEVSGKRGGERREGWLRKKMARNDGGGSVACVACGVKLT